MVDLACAHNAKALSPTGSDNCFKRKTRASSVEVMEADAQHLQIQQQQQQQGDGTSAAAPPPFLTKTYDMIDDPASDVIVSWTTKGASFVVWNPPEFARDLLPRYFKHNNFSSFVRQLNTYGFRKIDPDRWEFANEGFRRGHKHLLKNIHRRKPSHHGQNGHHQHQHGQGSEITKAGLEGNVEKLHRENDVLKMELVRMRHQQQSTERELQLMGQRLHGTEQRQQHMISFMAKAIESPAILCGLVQQPQQNEGISYLPDKRRRLELCNEYEEYLQEGGQIVRYSASSESTRARLIEFFSRPDLGSKLEVEPLEDLVRQLVPVDDDKHDERDCPTRATLVEMHNMLPVSVEQRLSTLNTPAAGAAAAAAAVAGSAPMVTDITNNHNNNQSSCIDVPATPPLELALETPVSPSPSEGGTMDGDAGGTSGGSSSGRMSDTTTRLFKLVGEVSASIDSGAVGVGMNTINNNGFWEQFLSSASEGGTRQEHQKSSAESDSGLFLAATGIGIRIGSDQESS